MLISGINADSACKSWCRWEIDHFHAAQKVRNETEDERVSSRLFRLSRPARPRAGRRAALLGFVRLAPVDGQRRTCRPKTGGTRGGDEAIVAGIWVAESCPPPRSESPPPSGARRASKGTVH